MSAIADLTCAALTRLYWRGALSPVEVAQDVLARIERNAGLNAFLPIEPEPVLAAAKESEARWRAAAPLGAIDGVPASIKDNIWAKGLPTRRGSKTSNAKPAEADSPATARLREQGAVILGKTCMPEHGWIGACHSPLTGITRNPWNPEVTPVEPPGVTSGFHGLRVMPVSGLWQAPIQPCSGMQVLPRITAPCSRKRAVAGESASAGLASLVLEPRRVGRPLAQILSLIEAGTPSMAPSGAAARQRASDSLAAASTGSGSIGKNAFSPAFRSIRANKAWSARHRSGRQSRSSANLGPKVISLKA